MKTDIRKDALISQILAGMQEKKFCPWHGKCASVSIKKSKLK